MEGGPPGFRQDFSCPALLRNKLGIVTLSPTGLSPSMARHSITRVRLALLSHDVCPTTPPKPKLQRFGLIRVRSPLLAESRLISLPTGTEMFHFPALARYGLWIQPCVLGDEPQRVAPFGDPRIKRLCAATRGLSQLATSFFAFQRQGIHRVPLVT